MVLFRFEHSNKIRHAAKCTDNVWSVVLVIGKI